MMEYKNANERLKKQIEELKKYINNNNNNLIS